MGIQSRGSASLHLALSNACPVAVLLVYRAVYHCTRHHVASRTSQPAAMSRRSLGIPSIDAGRKSKKARFATLGVHLPPAAAPTSASHPHRVGPVLRQGARAARRSERPSDSIADIQDAVNDYERHKYATSGHTLSAAAPASGDRACERCMPRRGAGTPSGSTAASPRSASSSC